MHIIAQQSPLLVQINPVEVDGKDVKFDLKDSQNASANLDFTVKDYTSLLTVGSRAANSNGLYELAIDDKALNDNDAKAFLDNFEANNGSDKRYAVTAGSVRSEYNVLCSDGEGKVENLTFDIINSSYVPVKNDIDLKGNEETIDNALLQEGEWYTISADMTQIYDIFVSTDKDSETLYGIECNNAYNFTLDDKTVITDNKKSSDLAAIDDKESTITLTGSTDGNGLQKGYKQELIVNIKNVKFAGVWNYGTADDVDYSFKIKVMSPLYEGKIVAAGDVVEIQASDLDGHEVNGSDILGYTYNNIEYSIFPDKESKTGVDYKRKEVKEVKFASMDTNIFTSADTAVGYTPATDKSPAKNGYVVVKPKNLAETTDSKLKVTLTDAWGYKKVVEIPVRVVVGE